MNLVEHLEGRTRLLVPPVSLKADPPPTSPVFFNPAASVNRDVSVAIAAATGGDTFCDAMAGVGSRGLRIANEAEGTSRVVLVDFNRRALGIAKKAAALNGVMRKCEFAEAEASSYLHSRFGRGQRFDCVDVDPFGTPVRQVQGGLAATVDGGILSATATDTAVLCGVHREVCRRRYGAAPLNNSFGHETAARILAGYVVREGASMDLGAVPVAAHSTRHYVRVYLRVESGASRAEAALSGMGQVAWCPACGHASMSEGAGGCERCGKRTRGAGPLWAGALVDPAVVSQAAKAAAEKDLPAGREVLRSLEGVEGFPPWSFSIERVCSALRTATIPEREVYAALREVGFRAMRTPFEKTGVKTDASYADVVAATKGAAGRHRVRVSA